MSLDLTIFNMNVGGALIAVGDETTASGSRPEVPEQLITSIANLFSVVSFTNVNSTATPTEASKITTNSNEIATWLLS